MEIEVESLSNLAVEAETVSISQTKSHTHTHTHSHSHSARPPMWDGPSWNPNDLCVGCGVELGIERMPVIFNDEDWHYACLQVLFKAREEMRIAARLKAV